jgi:hypothetical protein
MRTYMYSSSVGLYTYAYSCSAPEGKGRCALTAEGGVPQRLRRLEAGEYARARTLSIVYTTKYIYIVLCVVAHQTLCVVSRAVAGLTLSRPPSLWDVVAHLMPVSMNSR